MSPVLFQEALLHVPDNAIVIEIAPHSLLQAVLRRALASTCTVVGLMDKRQSDNLVHLLTVLGKYVYVDFYCIGRMLIKLANMYELLIRSGGHPFVRGRNEYQPKGGGALRLGSEGSYGLCVGGR